MNPPEPPPAPSDDAAPWEYALCRGFLPFMTRDEVAYLLTAAERDDPRLIQGHTTEPLPWPHNYPEPARCGCLLTLGAILTGAGLTVGDCVNRLADLQSDASAEIGAPAASVLVRWFDETPRSLMRAALIPVLRRELAERDAP